MLDNPRTLFGIAFTSVPQGTESDSTFSDFIYVTYLSERHYYNQNQSYYDELGAQHREDGYSYLEQCGDYERYLTTVTKFTFADVSRSGTDAGQAPLPPAIALFCGGLGVLAYLVDGATKHYANRLPPVRELKRLYSLGRISAPRRRTAQLVVFFRLPFPR